MVYTRGCGVNDGRLLQQQGATLQQKQQRQPRGSCSSRQQHLETCSLPRPYRPILNRYLPHILVPRVSQANGAAQAAPDQSSGKVARARCLAVGLTLCRPRSGFASKFYRWETQVPARAASSSATVKTRCNSTARSLVPTTTSRLNP